MTPFGQAMRRLRAERGVSQKEMAAALGVSAAYLSALEHGRRGRPGWQFTQRVIGYFNIIWDDAEELERLAVLSQPRVSIDTARLSMEARLFAHRLANVLPDLDDAAVAAMDAVLDRHLEAGGQKGATSVRRGVATRD